MTPDMGNEADLRALFPLPPPNVMDQPKDSDNGATFAGVVAALQSLGAGRAPNSSDEDQANSAEQAGAGMGQGQQQQQLREQIMLEQFKLAQLKQLQELQQQIFQQQMALINGGTALENHQNQPQQRSFLHGLPTPGSSTELRPSQPIPVEFVSPMLLNYDSTVLSPVFPPHDSAAGLDVDFTTLTPLSGHPNNFGFDSNPTSTNGVSASTRAQDHYFNNRGTASAPAHIAFGNPYSSTSHHSHSSQNHTTNMGNGLNPMHSIPTATGVMMSSEPSSPMHSELDFDVSPLTSPWLGASGKGTPSPWLGPTKMSNNGRLQAYGKHHPRLHDSNSNSTPTPIAGTKRAASPTSADIDIDGTGNMDVSDVFGAGGNSEEMARAQARKRQASISSTSPNTMRPSASPAIRPSNRSGSGGSRSMNSTPLLRAHNSNSSSSNGAMMMRGSGGAGMGMNMNSPLAMTMGTGGAPFSGPSPPSMRGMGGMSMNGGGMSMNSGMGNMGGMNPSNVFGSANGNNAVGDSPSPVDLSNSNSSSGSDLLSMPPPAHPASAFGGSNGLGTGGNTSAGDTLVPVTPASIMNLGVSWLNGSSHSPTITTQTQATSSASVIPSSGTSKAATATKKGKNDKDKEKDKDKIAGPAIAAGVRRSGRKAAVVANDAGTGLKHILPAGGHTSSSSSSTLPPAPTTTSSSRLTSGPASASSTSTILPMKERKTSHKAAEQKRRDSLKTTFDDLRGLLPPIPTSVSSDGSSAAEDPTAPEHERAFASLFKASLSSLPGALPPRGPPKAGGEGPNKAVSKLQLLICGNEYLRVLKGRVERRDDEVERLRGEVRRLRAMVGHRADRADEGGMEIENGSGENKSLSEYNSGGILDLDLDRDLDEIEVLESLRAMDGGRGAGEMLSVQEEDVEEE